VPSECVAGGFLLALHPFLGHHLGGPTCADPGTTGTWHSITGSTDGWKQVAYDVSGFAGRQVEVSITYVTDPGTGGVGAFVDDTRIVVDGAASADGFEGESSRWTVGAPPPGSPAPSPGMWAIGGPLVNFYAGTSTADTLLLGFGLEQLATDEDRRELLERTLGGLIGGDGT
jgi:hypothetical protein